MCSVKQINDSFLSKNDTLIIKGIAVVLLLSHHMWGFPERIPGDLFSLVGLIDPSLLKTLGEFGRICVAIFAFLGGYGKYLKYRDKKVNVFSEIKKLYLKYWQVFVVFVPIGFVFFRNQIPYCENESICSRFADFSVKDLILNLTGVMVSYNKEWWFVFIFAICICLFPLIRHMADRLSLIVNTLIVLVFQLSFLLLDESNILSSSDLYMRSFWHKSPYVACFYIGILIARHDLFSKLNVKLSKIRYMPVFSALIITLIIVIRETLDNVALDSVYVILFVFFVKYLYTNNSIVKKAFAFLGKHSTNMWLTHTFFCYYFGPFAKSIMFFRFAVPTLIVLLIYSLVASVLLSLFWTSVSNLTTKSKISKISGK